jgi:endonuclease/exonuclease/phosphatase family metal-dependent hydrolase
MARFVRTFAKRILIIINIIIVVLFLLACLNRFLHPDQWWLFSLLGLAFPLLLILVFGFFIFWILFRSRWTFLSMAALLIGFTSIRVLVGFHFGASFKEEKQKDAIRILTWNVAWFNEPNKKKKGFEDYRKKMLAFIDKQDADILCFQEYLESPARTNLKSLVKLNYPYHYKVCDYTSRSGYQVGVAIFSRFPITDSLRIRYPGPETLRAAESLIGVDLDIKGKKIRVYTTHLQSVLFQKTDYRNLEIIKNADDSLVMASKSIVRKLRRGYTLRGYQADLVRERLDACPYPEIICGDFNDVPNSYTYYRIKGDRQDAFIRRSSGIGRTFSHISPTLRIDFTMADKAFTILQYKSEPLPYSDHYPVVTDILLPKDEGQ